MLLPLFRGALLLWQQRPSICAVCLSGLQVALHLRECRISLLDAGRQLLLSVLGGGDGALQLALTVLAVAHEFVKESLFLLTLSSHFLLHGL